MDLNEHDEPETDEREDALFLLIDTHWKPAAKPGARVQMLTTERLFDIINKHAPGEYDPNLVSAVLLRSNFVTVNVANELRWLVLPR